MSAPSAVLSAPPAVSATRPRVMYIGLPYNAPEVSNQHETFQLLTALRSALPAAGVDYSTCLHRPHKIQSIVDTLQSTPVDAVCIPAALRLSVQHLAFTEHVVEAVCTYQPTCKILFHTQQPNNTTQTVIDVLQAIQRHFPQIHSPPNPRVLGLGLGVDHQYIPEERKAMVQSKIDEVARQLPAAGVDWSFFVVRKDDVAALDERLNQEADSRPLHAVLVGFGLRAQEDLVPLLEQIVERVRLYQPQARVILCLNPPHTQILQSIQRSYPYVGQKAARDQ